MAVEPDTKDWTWVLTRPCFECGFDPSTLPARDVADALRANSASWRAVLEDPNASRRPIDSQWSALEYGCHVRDVFELFNRRLALMLAEDDPLFENWDQDKRAVEDRYSSQDPQTVAGQIEQAGTDLATAFDAVPDDAWSRIGRRSDGAVFSIESFARYLLHDAVHHVYDVRRGYQILESG